MADNSTPTYGGSEKKPLLQVEEQKEETAEHVGEHEKPTGCRGVIRRLLMNDSNPDFAFSMEVAVRGAIFVTIAGLPFVMPPGLFPTLELMMEHGMYTPGVVTFFVYNYAGYLGDVVNGVTGGLRGTILAVIFTWFMFALFPDGVEPDSPPYVFWFGVCCGVLVIFGMFILNFNIGTTIFTVSNFVFFLMSFMDPKKDNWAPPGSGKFKILDDVGIHSIFTLAVGGLLAILACLLPYPLLALTNACEIAEELSSQMPRMWRLMFDYFAADEPNIYLQDTVHRRLNRLETIAGKLKTRVASAWWECLGLGKRNQTRRMLTALETSMQASYDRIKGTWVIAGRGKWKEPHVKLMQAMRPSFEKAVDTSEKLIGTCMKEASVGEVSDEGAKLIAQGQKDMKAALAEMAKDLKTIRTQMADKEKGEKRTVSSYCLDEHLEVHVLCTNFTAYVRHVDLFATKLLDQRSNPDTLPTAHAAGGFAAIFDGIWERNNIMFMLRGCSSIFSALLLGYLGYGELLGNFTATVACTAAVLQSRFLGSALVKNLGRIQGVVLGSIIGEIARSFFPTCQWWNITLRITITFLYAVLTLFIYHNSVFYSYIGCLLAAFGVQKMLTGQCVRCYEEHKIDKAADYSVLISTVFAVGLIIIFDMILSTSRASDKAGKGIVDAASGFEETVQGVFDKSKTNITFHKVSLGAKIDNATDMGHEALQEPRYWRTEWKNEAFMDCIKYFRHMRYSVIALEYALVEEGKDGAAKNDAAKGLEKIPQWNELGKLMGHKMTCIKKLLGIFLHETVERFPALMDKEATTQLGPEVEEAFSGVIAQVKGMQALVKEGVSLEEDPLCEICMVMGAVQAIFLGMRKVQHVILRN